MKKIFVLTFLILALIMTVSVSAQSVDSITAASGDSYYSNGSYDMQQLKSALSNYPYSTAISVATVNDDGSPNIAVAIPALSEDGKYLTFGLADNRTKDNFISQKLAVVMFYEYTPSAEKAERNKGCKLVIKYVGNSENDKLNKAAGKEYPALFMEIVKLLPIG